VSFSISSIGPEHLGHVQQGTETGTGWRLAWRGGALARSLRQSGTSSARLRLASNPKCAFEELGRLSGTIVGHEEKPRDPSTQAMLEDLTEQRLRRGVFRDVEGSIVAIGDYTDKHPKPFVWTANASDVLEKVKRARAAPDNR